MSSMGNDVYDTRVYTSNDWAVKRWDWLHNGKVVEPKSFCQFWRTVLLWCTLATVFPFFKDFAQTKAHEEEVQQKVVPTSKAVPPRWVTFLTSVIGVIYLPFQVLWNVFGFVADVATDIDRPVGKLCSALWSVVLIALFCGALGFTGHLIYDALPLMFDGVGHFIDRLLSISLTDYLVGGGAVLLVAVVMTFLVYHTQGLLEAGDRVMMFFKDVIVNAASALLGIGLLLVDGARVGHKKICPPMAIRRE